MWHRRLWLIDHGAALIFHHQWEGYLERSTGAFPMIRDHVLLGFATRIEQADAEMTRRLTAPVIEDIVALVPDDWLESTPAFASPQDQRQAYLRYFARAPAGAARFRGGGRPCRIGAPMTTRSCGSCRTSSAGSSSTPA